MKKFILIAVIGLLTFAVQAQDKKAQIKFKAETVDYGEIQKGSDGIRVFEFTNTGDAPLVIENVKSSCGCTVPEKPTEAIMPGANGTIKVKYDTNRVGPIRKTITVYSNADEPVKAIKIKGTVLDPDSKKSVLEKTK